MTDFVWIGEGWEVVRMINKVCLKKKERAVGLFNSIFNKLSLSGDGIRHLTETTFLTDALKNVELYNPTAPSIRYHFLNVCESSSFFILPQSPNPYSQKKATE